MMDNRCHFELSDEQHGLSARKHRRSSEPRLDAHEANRRFRSTRRMPTTHGSANGFFSISARSTRCPFVDKSDGFPYSSTRNPSLEETIIHSSSATRSLVRRDIPFKEAVLSRRRVVTGAECHLVRCHRHAILE